MRVAVIGAGGTGALLGASLQQAGHDVAFLARGIHLAAMKSDGLRIESERGNSHLHRVKATDNAAEIGVVDAIVFCVKLWDVESAGEQIRPLVGSETCLIPLQNGIEASRAARASSHGESSESAQTWGRLKVCVLKHANSDKVSSIADDR